MARTINRKYQLKNYNQEQYRTQLPLNRCLADHLSIDHLQYTSFCHHYYHYHQQSESNQEQISLAQYRAELKSNEQWKMETKNSLKFALKNKIQFIIKQFKIQLNNQINQIKIEFRWIFLLTILLTILNTGVYTNKVTENGDILLGGLFPIHQKGRFHFHSISLFFRIKLEFENFQLLTKLPVTWRLFIIANIKFLKKKQIELTISQGAISIDQCCYCLLLLLNSQS